MKGYGGMKMKGGKKLGSVKGSIKTPFTARVTSGKR